MGVCVCVCGGIINTCCPKFGFLLLYGSWGPLDSLKILPRGTPMFSTPGNAIPRLFEKPTILAPCQVVLYMLFFGASFCWTPQWHWAIQSNAPSESVCWLRVLMYFWPHALLGHSIQAQEDGQKLRVRGWSELKSIDFKLIELNWIELNWN